MPVARDRIAVTDLLPASIQVVNGAFRVPLHSGSASVRLRDVCGPTCALSGARVPKPAFAVTLPLALKRPTDFASVTLAGGDTVHVELTQALGFPLLDTPGAAAPGSIGITLVLGADTVRERIDGATQPWPSGTALDIALPLPAGGTLSADVGVLVEIDSPAGDSVTIDGAAELSARVGVGGSGEGTIGITSVSALVRSVSISSESVTLDLSGIGEDIATRADSAVLTFAIANPLEAVGRFTVDFTAGERTLIPPREITIEPGSSSVRLDLTQSELEALLGERVTLAMRGTVAATASSGLVTIRPADVMTVDTRLMLSIALP